MCIYYVCRLFSKRHENLLKELEKKKDTHRESLTKLQHSLQQAQVKAAAKS